MTQVNQPQPPYLAPYPARLTPDELSDRYHALSKQPCLCGHTYAAHRILGGDCTVMVYGSSWRPCPCMQFQGRLDD